jgi:ParB/RepB/Spo0J family partition protein
MSPTTRGIPLLTFTLKAISIDDLVMDKPNPEDRTIVKDFAENIAKSIQSDGLLHEPIVRSIPDRPGKYKVIAGRHRVIACSKYLGWTEIPCKIAPESMTDEEAKAIELAENLFRNNLDNNQLKKALAGWHAIYIKSHPLAEGSGSGAKVEKVVREKVAEAEAKGEIVDKEAIAAQVAAEAKPFAKVLQETLHVSPATAGRLARVAKNLDETQLDVLAANKVNDGTLDKLAALGSKEHIDKAIGLIASGMDHSEAVRQAGKAKGQRKAVESKQPPNPLQKALVPKASTATPVSAKDSELTDDEWIENHCDVILKSLKHKGPFKKDAILYRRLAGVLVKFRSSVDKPLAEAKSTGNGGFYASLFKTVKTAHPSQWKVCDDCNGNGVIRGTDKSGKEVNVKCSKCMGAAYLPGFES